MTGLRPVLDLLRGAVLRFKARTVNPMAPADLLLPLALKLADLERRA